MISSRKKYTTTKVAIQEVRTQVKVQWWKSKPRKLAALERTICKMSKISVASIILHHSVTTVTSVPIATFSVLYSESSLPQLSQ